MLDCEEKKYEYLAIKRLSTSLVIYLSFSLFCTPLLGYLLVYDPAREKDYAILWREDLDTFSCKMTKYFSFHSYLFPLLHFINRVSFSLYIAFNFNLYFSLNF